MIETRGLTKEYGKTTAVRDLDLHVEKGEIYGFLGPNGAGKTTTIMMILGLVKPTRGEALIFGSRLDRDYFGLKRRIGVVAEVQRVYEDMTAWEYLNFFGQLYGVPDIKTRAADLLSRLDLYDRRNELLSNYSKGMLQKVNIARALIHDPELLILDEPVSSLDPYGIKEVRDLIMEEHRRGKTIFISSHLLSEVERTCNRVGILDQGTLVAEDTMQSLREKLASEIRLLLEVDAARPEIIEAIRRLPFVKSVEVEDNRVNISTNPDADYRLDVSRAVSEAGGTVMGLSRQEMSLEDAFITITEKHVSQFARKEA
ncbi:MAG TPA: ABC transporter ATP-binding protein [Firmicutes bacterium]|nr:ABC transporter ATP-binding protein [Bacillota bacterium]